MLSLGVHVVITAEVIAEKNTEHFAQKLDCPRNDDSLSID